MKYRSPHCEMFPINYGQPVPWDKLEPGEEIYVVDFSFPAEDMKRLDSDYYLVWIDHHKTAIDAAEEAGFFPLGRRRVGTAACQLTWDYVMNKPVPDGVRLLGEYDVWDHADPLCLPFQYGFRFFENTLPDNQGLWAPFFERNTAHLVDAVCQTGQTILTYEQRQNERFCRTYAFETKLLCTSPTEGTRWYSAICANRGHSNSKLFDAVYDAATHDLMITFCRSGRENKWLVSLYTTHAGIDCGAIARTFGGGGHRGAAGFQCVELPFEILGGAACW